MDALECINTRRSIRRYQEKSVEDDVIFQVLRAGMMAPSAHNEQPWHFIVVKERERLERVSGFHPYIRMAKNAPVGILVCGDVKLNKSEREFWLQDCSAATQNILLAIHALGLGGVWTGIYPNERLIEVFRKEFNLPENVIPFSFIPLGYPAEKSSSQDRFNKSRIHLENWK
jgi:nitroreductase